jgi:A/G-specific adenine glycosylase
VNDQFSDQLLAWFDSYGRHDLPWQQEPDPYHVWLSEIMLQQTQVATVIPYYNRFLQRFPTIKLLADADIDAVLSYWAGLGYYARGRNLHRAAKIICDNFAGDLPADKEQLLTLPGIGRSTAGAIMALAFKRHHAILDGNVKRVLCRFYAVPGWPGESAVEKQLWQLAEELTPEINVARYTQAIMDLGATVCTRSKPQCDICPVALECLARKQESQEKYPATKPKKTIPLRETVFLLLENRKGEILFEKRPATGIWGGLWCFPECSPDDDIEAWLLAKTGFSVSIIQKLSIIKHRLTHFRMEILPVHLKVKQCNNVNAMSQQQWCLSADALKFGVPAPVRNLLLTMSE